VGLEVQLDTRRVEQPEQRVDDADPAEGGKAHDAGEDDSRERGDRSEGVSEQRSSEQSAERNRCHTIVVCGIEYQ